MQGNTLAGRFAVTEGRGDDGVFARLTARDAERDADVTLQILLPQFAGDAELIGAFRAAATAATKLSHPHIAAPFYVGADAGNGIACFVAEESTGDIDL
ncbi:MAG: hypothetical protein H7Y38_15990, partial [Armatimonadetes bacterium]|nr:hypothetical protein [Armatimonadota bacterium]